MKFTKLSLITAVAISSAFAGGDIEPIVTPVIVEEVVSNTTINGKLTGYYITDDSTDDMFGDQSQLAFAATLDVTHNFTENIAMNFGAIGYINALKKPNMMYMESNKDGAIMNVANLTATFADTTFILGRQLLDTPMLGGFDWLLAPGSFEAYTMANSSIENLTLVASYVREWRPNNAGDDFINLTDINDGNHWTLGAVYDNKTISASVWYYNVDAFNYTQVYADAGYNFEVAKIEAQYVNTDYDFAVDSDLFGLKASATLGTFSLMAAYSNASDNVAGFVGRDTIYTSSWNTFASQVIGDSFKVEAGTEFSGISATASYAYYEYEQDNDEGHEIDLILGYNITDSIDVNAVYTNTDYGLGEDVNALEIYANYKF